ENVITVWSVVVESNASRSPLAVGIGNFEGRVANLERGVGDRACAGFVFRQSFCAESRLHEREKVSRAFYAKVGVQILNRVRSVVGARGVRSEIPVIADRIFDASFAVAVVYLARCVERFCAGLDGRIVGRVDVADVIVQSGEKRLNLGATNIAHFEHGVTEFDGGVRDLAAGFRGANGFLGVKGGLEEVEETRDPADDEIRRDVTVASGTGACDLVMASS